MCAVVSTDSALHNADADTDDEGSHDLWLARAKQRYPCSLSTWCTLVCVVNQDDLEKTEAIPISFKDVKKTDDDGGVLYCELVRLFGQRRKRA